MRYFLIFFFSLNVIFSQDFEKKINQINNKLSTNFIENINSQYSYDVEKSKQQMTGNRSLSNAPELYDNAKKSVVLIITSKGSGGSGSVVDENGYIITNYHVIENQTNKSLKCVLWDDDIEDISDISKNELVDVDIVGVDPTKDLALLKISTDRNLDPIKFGNSYSIKIAQDVFAIGHPSGYLWYYTNGTVNRVAKTEWNYGENYTVSAQTVFTQTPINPGNSGGPLLNNKGRMIGINSAGSTKMQNVNYAVRIDEVKNFIKDAKIGKFTTKTTISNKLEDAKWIGLLDENNNGKFEYFSREGYINDIFVKQIGVDENEDGIFDYIAVDTNQDNIEDILMYDRRKDGKYTYWIVDSDFDGKADWEGQR